MKKLNRSQLKVLLTRYIDLTPDDDKLLRGLSYLSSSLIGVLTQSDEMMEKIAALCFDDGEKLA